MKITTSRFGVITLAEEDSIFFREGLLGFSDLRTFVLLDDPNDEIFAWLQSCEDGSVAFPVLEPELFVPDYRLCLAKSDRASMSAESDLELLRSFAIITIPSDPTQMTANLKAPIVINVKKRIARQCVLQDNSLAIQEPIFARLQQRFVQNPKSSLKTQAVDWGVAVRLPDRASEVDL